MNPFLPLHQFLISSSGKILKYTLNLLYSGLNKKNSIRIFFITIEGLDAIRGLALGSPQT